jgi:predicted MPP superfamily phosphohydrolase
VGKVYYDTNTIEVRNFEIQDSSLGEVIGGLKVGHLSDLHVKKIGKRENKLLEIMRQEKPDIIFLTGDLIGFKSPYESVEKFFKQIDAPYGVYAVLGNTEYSNENGSCSLCHVRGSKERIKNPKPIFLRNSSVTINIRGKALRVTGVDDPVSKKNDLTLALQHFSGFFTLPARPPASKALSLNPQPLESFKPRILEPSFSGSTILLSHSPELFQEASNYGIAMVFSGHTHGGQIFLVRYLKKIIPLEPALQYLDGFFHQGKSTMYVSRGVGTSLLPFRLGVKPEITFFKFSKDFSTASQFSVKNSSAVSFFAGWSLSGIFDLFEVDDALSDSACYLRLAADDLYDSLLRALSSIGRFIGFAPEWATRPNGLHSAPTLLLYDFESEEDLSNLNWECHKWFELSQKHATSGKGSLRMEIPSGQYPGIKFREFPGDWSKGQRLRMDVFNPSRERVKFHIRIDDKNSGWEYENRFDKEFVLGQGMTQIFVSLSALKTNLHSQPMDLKNIERFMVFVPDNRLKRELFLDNIRIE